MARWSPAPASLRSRPRHARPSCVAPLLSAVIVNYRRWEETAALARQLTGQEHIFGDRLETVVIDNASPPSPRQHQIAQLPRTKLIRLPENVGFSAGVNAGLEHSRGRWILVLNPDVMLDEGFVDRLASLVLEREQQAGPEGPVGIMGCRLRNRDRTHQYSTGRFPSLTRIVLGLLRPRARRKYSRINITRRQQACWVTGSCLLVRRSCLKQLGGFDESFFLYYEDVDLCRRAQAKGWSVWYEPELQATHLDPLHNRRLTAPLRAICRHAALTYFKKHAPGWRFRALAWLVQAEASVRLAVARLRGRNDDATVAREVVGLCRKMRGGDAQAARAHLTAILRRADMLGCAKETLA